MRRKPTWDPPSKSTSRAAAEPRSVRLCGWTLRLDFDRPAIFEFGIFDHDGNSVANDAIVRVVAVFNTPLVDHADVSADAAILVDDGPFDDAAAVNAQRGMVGTAGPLHIRRLVEIGTHDDRIANRDVLADDAAQADHAVFNDRSLPNAAAVGDQAALDLRTLDAVGGRKRARE